MSLLAAELLGSHLLEEVAVSVWLDLILIEPVSSSLVFGLSSGGHQLFPPFCCAFFVSTLFFVSPLLCRVTEFPQTLKILVLMSATFESSHLLHTCRTLNSSELS